MAKAFKTTDLSRTDQAIIKAAELREKGFEVGLEWRVENGRPYLAPVILKSTCSTSKPHKGTQ